MQAHVDKLSGLDESGTPKRKTEVESDTLKDSKSGTPVKSWPNWHISGGTKEATGGPVKVEGREAMVRVTVDATKER